RRRIAAVVHEVGPVGIALLGDVAAEGLEKIERMLVGEAMGLKDGAQCRAFRIAALAVQRRFHPRELLELPVRRGVGRIGAVVGRAGKAIEGEDRRAQFAAHQPRCDREVLVAMVLARGESGGVGHDAPIRAWARPFHWPPWPRQTATADCTVKTVYAAAI